MIDATGFSLGFGNPTVNLVLVHVVYGLGFTTLFFRNYYETFPTELIKAAQIDGASFFQIFRRILLPNSAPIFIVTVIYQFTNIWNDFLFGSTFAAGDSAPMTVALYNHRQHLDRRHRIQRQYGGGDHRRRADPRRLHSRRTLFRARPDGRRGERISPMATLEIRALRKRFGSLEILKGIDISLEQGGFLVLVGPSGCGKSTLLNTIAGLESISSGEILIGGQVVNDLHPSKRDIAMVFQSYALYPNMSVGENIAFGMEMRGVPKPEREKAVAAVAKTLQIEHLLERRPSQLSGGQRQRVAMGRALVRQPQRVPVRRAALESRRQAARRHARRDQAAASADRNDNRLCHARPDRGDDARDQDRRPEGWRAAAGRDALRDLQFAVQSLRRRFHGFAGDESP